MKWDLSVADQSTVSLMRHILATDTATPIVATTGGVGADPYVYRAPRASEDVSKVYAVAYETGTGNQYPAALHGNTGEVVFLGSALGSYERMIRGDWIDENTIVYAHGTEVDAGLTIVDTFAGTITETISLADDRIFELWSVHVSPDRTIAALAASYKDETGTPAEDRLILARVAAPQ